MNNFQRNLTVTTASDWALRVAFASSDLQVVNQHFGSTPRLVIYGVKPDRVTLLQVTDFIVQPGHDLDKLSCRIAALEGCLSLYCVAVGDSVFRQLLRVGVRAVNVPADTAITQLLTELQQNWDAPTVVRHQVKRDPQRFERLAQESRWEED
ncbi:NifB/NifX family molybdenum-iron cluster-binding protein [Acerihabitans sp. TG2]|uniref:NifB/NifX family molybdenum-iron cluster-binding protein n=1 Tax=Acerihabitans sp. TG2 TaxID=3096008 RepID=UPI002B221F77|nr:NifB/NifX family molybdenum-iron cluster-binding protein [Acerihabitans sp. TG2]MEA9393252.1 NifB/NifX family molybdenum-iron cluster-binding protein [Acerihabitans sp. TG2]